MEETKTTETNSPIQPTTVKRSGKPLIIIAAIIVLCFVCCCLGTIGYSIYTARALSSLPNTPNNSNNNSDEPIQKATTQEALAFNDGLVDIQKDIQEEFLKYTKELTTGTKSEVYKVLENSRNGIKNYEIKAQLIKMVQGGDQFKTTGLSLFSFYEKAIDKYAYKIVDIRFDETLTNSAAQTKLNLTSTAFAAEEKPYIDAFLTAQDNFAKFYNIELVEDKDLDVTDQVNP